MNARLEALAKRCKNRGGDCPCVGQCQAIKAANEKLEEISIKERALKQNRNQIDNLILRLKSKPATLKSDFIFTPNLQPVIVFDGNEASFGYEDENDEWIEQNVWPFNEDYVWADDCERLGFRVE